eukprot:TRINITY_DN5790_c0_g1_i1.p1 TRINITY_DN5790_c0_g1~~TRINITY_DN5790_c0_g1_i1.p1  ORF type:complete len:256 (-),score=33.42 TRINITY_DN5790_c0_g1_i1:114-767(-)
MKQPVEGDVALSGKHWYINRFLRWGGSASDGKGCSVKGYVSVERTKGNLHIAAGAAHSQQHSDHKHHVHRLRPQDLTGTFNISHKFFAFSSGPHYSGRKSPLAHQFIQTEEQAQVTYLVRFVPVIYEKANGVTHHTFSYTVSQTVKSVNFHSSHFPLPGLFVKWEIAPFTIKHSERGYSFSRYLTRIFAVIGGTFAVLGLFYKGASGIYSTLKEKAA